MYQGVGVELFQKDELLFQKIFQISGINPGNRFYITSNILPGNSIKFQTVMIKL